MVHGERGGRVPRPRRDPADVFLNIPYDEKFQRLFLAYIAGLAAFGLVPRASLEIPGSQRRLDRVFKLIKMCRYAIHDLSRVEVDGWAPRTPRFNMPFELGLSVAWDMVSKKGRHTWFVCESQDFRLSKSLSDLNGTDAYVHNGTIAGVFRELSNAFVRSGAQPSVLQMGAIYRDVRKNLPRILRAAGTKSLFKAKVFKELCIVAAASAREHERGPKLHPITTTRGRAAELRGRREALRYKGKGESRFRGGSD